MKGTLFLKPLEFSLFAEGESWNQGDTISGKLKIRNHSSETVSLEGLHVSFGWGDLKKVHQKSPEAFDLLNRAALTTPALKSQDSVELDWKLQTHLNFPITDTTSSVFLLYGLGDATEKLGQLQVSIKPAPIIQEFLKAVTIQFRFVIKTLKASKTGVNVKLSPPAARAFSNVEQLMLRFDLDETNLNVDYEFQVKSMSATPGPSDLKKQKKELSQALVTKDLYDSAGRPRHEKIEGYIREAVDLVESKISY